MALRNSQTQVNLRPMWISRGPCGSAELVLRHAFSSGCGAGDVWEVELSKGDPVWLVDSRVKFKYLDTKSWLSSSGRQFGRPINGQKEICGQDKGPAGNWMATEGVYLPQRAPS